MSKSFSHGEASKREVLFLQESSNSPCSKSHRLRRAARAMREAASKSKSAKLTALAARMRMGGHFDKVVEDLDGQLTKLEEEQTKDTEMKEKCIADRSENTQTAKDLSQQMDDHTAFINQKNAEIADLNKRINEVVTNIVDLEKELQQAKEIRAADRQEYEGNRVADETAISLIEQTAETLQKFYDENGLAFAQTGT